MTTEEALGLAKVVESLIADSDTETDRELLERLDKERLVDALEVMYDKYENGDPCFENPEELEGAMGNAVKLSFDEENEILALIPAYPKKSRAIDAARQKEQA